MSATRLHHPSSPSKLQYLEACGYWESEQSTNLAASERGTVQHDSAEDPIDIDNPALEDHEAIAVVGCKKYRDSIIAKVRAAVRPIAVAMSVCGNTELGNEPILLKEEYVYIDENEVVDAEGNKFKGTTGGYLDLAIVAANKKFAHILDWKFGKWSVEPAENNLQGIAYLLGVFRLFPTLEEVTVHFVMPHRDEIDTHTFKRSEFDGLLLRVKAVVARAMEFANAKKSDNWEKASCSVGACLFCGAKGRCHKLTEFALKLGKKYNPLLIPEQLNPSLMFKAESATQAMEVAQVLEGWAKATRARITANAIEDDAWMPAKYQLRSRQDTIVSNPNAFAAAARKAGVSETVIASAQKYKVEPIYKAVRDMAPRGQKEEAEKVFREQNLATGVTEKEQPIYFLERLKS